MSERKQIIQTTNMWYIPQAIMREKCTKTAKPKNVMLKEWRTVVPDDRQAICYSLRGGGGGGTYVTRRYNEIIKIREKH